jgi:hypothetical protein
MIDSPISNPADSPSSFKGIANARVPCPSLVRFLSGLASRRVRIGDSFWSLLQDARRKAMIDPEAAVIFPWNTEGWDLLDGNRAVLSQLLCLSGWSEGLLARVLSDIENETHPSTECMIYHLDKLRRATQDLKRGVELIRNAGCKNSGVLQLIDAVERPCYLVMGIEERCRAAGSDRSRVVRKLEREVKALLLKAKHSGGAVRQELSRSMSTTPFTTKQPRSLHRGTDL